MLDDGSAATIINASIINDIGAKKSKIQIALRGIGGEDAMIMSNENVSLEIVSEYAVFPVTNVLVVNQLALPYQHLSKNITDLCLLKTGIMIQPYNRAPDMLIGQDFSKLIITREFREINTDSLYVSRSLLGWTIHGHFNSNTNKNVYAVQTKSKKRVVKSHKYEDELDELVKFYFAVKSIGVNGSRRINEADKRALEILEKTSRYNKNEWEVGLLWKSDDYTFSDGKETALYRLKLLERKLDKDANYAKLYYSEMDRLINNGFAQKVDKFKYTDINKLRYLPHFGVQNVNKPGKVRLVFDAAAKSASKSFNDLLLPGPDLLKSLPGVIMRFRQFAFAVKSDMKDMFLKIKIRAEDRDAQRFLYRGDNRIKEPEEYLMSSMLFGATSSPCSALFIKNKNADLFSSCYPDSVKSLKNNCYMDDFLDSCETTKEAFIEINAKANWQMHSWVSNDKSVLSGIDNQTNNTSLVKMDSNGNIIEKVLGI